MSKKDYSTMNSEPVEDRTSCRDFLHRATKVAGVTIIAGSAVALAGVLPAQAGPDAALHPEWNGLIVADAQDLAYQLEHPGYPVAYFLVDQGAARLIPNYGTYTRLFRQGIKIQGRDNLLDVIVHGPDISNGALLAADKQDGVFFVDPDYLVRRLVANPAVFASYGFASNKIEWVDLFLLHAIPLGPEIV
jgi:hypothetical protein